ncbi:MAG: ferritin-like domain-containing protein [Acidimicrobiales bacterium]|jgi:hypothetical protein|nr:ferritin-like domain-containing protein [Acidimicrobiales bacterium]
MDFSTDETRRQLRAARRLHDEALPRFGAALRRAFDPDSNVTSTERAALVGVPERRRFLAMGGLGVAGAVVLSACGGGDEPVSQSGVVPSTTEPPEEEALEPGSAELDQTLLLTAISVEALAVAAYATAAESGLLTTALIADVAEVFGEQHQQHQDALTTTATDRNIEYTTDPNPYLLENTYGALLRAATTEGDIISLALRLENQAAATYTLAGGVFTLPELRQAALSIGATEARHAAVFHSLQLQDAAPSAFIDTVDAVPIGSYITPATEEAEAEGDLSEGTEAADPAGG